MVDANTNACHPNKTNPKSKLIDMLLLPLAPSVFNMRNENRLTSLKIIKVLFPQSLHQKIIRAIISLTWSRNIIPLIPPLPIMPKEKGNTTLTLPLSHLDM
jgi:hypothetical protein